MKLTLSILSIAFLAVVFSACSSSNASENNSLQNDSVSNGKPLAPVEEKLVEYDLNVHGVPAVVMAPENSKVTKGMGPASVSINGGNGFLVQVLYKRSEVASEVNALKEMDIDKTMNPDFEKVEVEEEYGYVAVYTGGYKSFSWGVAVKEGGNVVLRDDMMAIMASTGKMKPSGESADRMYKAAKLTKVTK